MVPLILPVDKNLKMGRDDDVCLAGNMSKGGGVHARHSDDQVRIGAKRYKNEIRHFSMNIGYLALTNVRVYIIPPTRSHWFLSLGLDIKFRENR